MLPVGTAQCGAICRVMHWAHPMFPMHPASSSHIVATMSIDVRRKVGSVWGAHWAYLIVPACSSLPAHPSLLHPAGCFRQPFRTGWPDHQLAHPDLLNPSCCSLYAGSIWQPFWIRAQTRAALLFPQVIPQLSVATGNQPPIPHTQGPIPTHLHPGLRVPIPSCPCHSDIPHF